MFGLFFLIIGENFDQVLVENYQELVKISTNVWSFFLMLYQAIVSYPSHLICNLLNLCKDKVEVSSDCKAFALQSKDTFEKKNSPAPTLSLQRFKRLQIK